MKKFFLFFLIVIDLAIMGATGYYLYLHLTHQAVPNFGGAKVSAMTPAPMLRPMSTTGLIKTSTATASFTGVPSASNSLITAPASTNAAAAAGMHHIIFKYNNPKAHVVSIRADFTGWKADPMKKDEKGVWTYTAPLTPGEYAYCFTVDDKTFRDPANQRKKQIGRTFVSSIVVKLSPVAKP